jgi:hypothetical protein
MTLDRLYFAADALVRRALRGVEAVHRGLWLGLMDRPALDRITQAMYLDARSYREAEYNRSGFHYWEQALVDRHLPCARRVLVAAAGGGREVVALARRGIHADGFDPDPDFVAAGNALLRELGLPGELAISAPGMVPAQFGGYDAAILGWNVYTHIPGRKARIDFLRAMASRLPDHAVVLLSFFPRNERDLAFKLTWWTGRIVGALRFRGDPVELGDTVMGGYFHHFSQGQLRQELAAAGLDLIEYGEHPQGYAVARRRAP